MLIHARMKCQLTCCSTCGSDRGTCSLCPSAMFFGLQIETIDKLFTLMKAHDGSHHVCCLCGGRVHLLTEDVRQCDTKAGKKLHEMSLCLHACCCFHVLAPSFFLLGVWLVACLWRGKRKWLEEQGLVCVGFWSRFFARLAWEAYSGLYSLCCLTWDLLVRGGGFSEYSQHLSFEKVKRVWQPRASLRLSSSRTWSPCHYEYVNCLLARSLPIV